MIMSKTPSRVLEDMQRQEFLELLYQRRGKDDGLYSGLFSEWAEIVLAWKRAQELRDAKS